MKKISFPVNQDKVEELLSKTEVMLDTIETLIKISVKIKERTKFIDGRQEKILEAVNENAEALNLLKKFIPTEIH